MKPVKQYSQKLIRKVCLGAVVPLLLLLAWHYLSQREGQISFPEISQVCNLLVNMGHTTDSLDIPSLWDSMLVSLMRTILGFMLAVLLAVPAGIVLGRHKSLREVFAPVFTIVYVVSPLAWLPILIALVGLKPLSAIIYGEAEAWQYYLTDNILPAMIVIIMIAAFFPILLTTERASRTVREDLVEAASLMGASGFAMLWRVIFPLCLPAIISGMRIGLGRAWMVIVAAEMYPGTRSGLGYTIWVSHSSLNYDYTFAAIFLIAMLGLLMNGILLLIEQHVTARESDC